MKNIKKIATEILGAFGRPSIQGPHTRENIIKHITVKDSTDYNSLAAELKFLIDEDVYWEDALIALENLNPKANSQKIQRAFKEKEGIRPDSYKQE
jgi:hypothetical protein